MKKMSSFRLDPLAASRLENLAASVGLSQAEFIENLINAAFDSQCESWAYEGFRAFRMSMREREKLINNEDSPE